MNEPDVVVELRRVLVEWYDTYGEPVPFDANAIQRAIDEILALRGENREMRRTFGSHPLFKEARAEALEEAAGEAGKWATGKAARSAIRSLKDRP